MNLKLFKNSASRVYSVLIYGEIGEELRGIYFAEELNYLNKYFADDIDEIQVRINSGGGSVLDALSMFNAIINSKIPVNTYIDGIAASSAGWVALAGKKRYMNDFGRVMIHDPYNTDGTEDKALQNIREMIVGILSNGSNKTQDEISAIMSAETWLNADQAQDMGLVDEVIFTGRNVALNSVKDAKAVVAIYNSILTKEDHKMKKVFNTLKLSADASEDSVLEAVNALKEEAKKVSGLEKRVADLTAENSAKLEQIQNFKNEKIENFVDAKIESGVYSKEEREELVTEAKNDFESFQRMTTRIEAKIANKSVDLIGQINNSTTESALPEEFKGMGLRAMEQKNEAKVAEIKNTNPALYEKLFVAEYGIKPIV